MAIVKKRRRLVMIGDDSVVKRVKYLDEGTLQMGAGSFYIPKYNESKPLGEDAHFISGKRQTIGVADGVGGWAKKGIDAGEYARELMLNSFMAICNQPIGPVDPKMVLNEAFLNTKAEGSSTACIVTLTGNILHAVNVGDSGFVLIREGKIVYRSPVQHSRFNCPYQLGNTRGHPSLAQELRVPAMVGDIIIVGSDGLFDNVHNTDIEEMVGRDLSKFSTPQEIARNVAQFAYSNSLDSCAISPFAIAARKEGFEFTGGKIDDITVIVAYLVPSRWF